MSNHFNAAENSRRPWRILSLGVVILIAAIVGFGVAKIDDSEGSTEVRPLMANGAAIDVHTHLASQLLADAFTGGQAPASDGESLVALLDEAKVQKAVVLSAGYMGWTVGITDDTNVTPENDFVAGEVAKYPDRLIGFCGINPLFDSAIDEIDRCLALQGMVGVKLHLPGSGVDLTKDEDVARLSAVFDEVAELDAPVLMHVGNPLGLPLDTTGLTNLMLIIEEHPSVRVVLAHCAGPRDDQEIDLWLRNREVTNNLFVEGSACLKYFRDAPAAQKELIVWRFRQWGIDRLLLGSDYLSFEPEETPGEAIETLLSYPFTQEEIDTILSNDGSAWLGQ